MVNQKYTSADISINVVNLVYKKFPFEKGSVVLDYGGGKYDTNQEYMASKGIKLMVFDPYNRSKTHNAQVLKRAKLGVDYIVCSNVLNVIAEPEVIRNVVETIKHLAKNKAKVVFAIYEGDKTGKGKVTTKGYQRNQKTADYMKLINEYFDYTHKKGNLIVAFN